MNRNVVSVMASSKRRQLEEAVGLRRVVVVALLALNAVLQLARERRVAKTMRARGGDVAAIGIAVVHRNSLEAGRVSCKSSGDVRHLSGTSVATSVSTDASLTLLDLTLNAAAIRRLADRGQNRAHAVDKLHALVGGRKLQRSLNDVVAVGVAHELFQLIRVHQLLYEKALGRHVSAANTLLDDVGAELLLGKLSNMTLEAQAHGSSEARIVEVEDVLHNIVAEGVLHQMKAVSSDLADQLDLLETGSVIDAALEDTAAMAVSADNDAVLANSIEDELGILRLEVVETLLNNMIAIQVLDQVDNLALKRLDNELDLSDVSKRALRWDETILPA